MGETVQPTNEPNSRPSAPSQPSAPSPADAAKAKLGCTLPPTGPVPPQRQLRPFPERLNGRRIQKVGRNHKKGLGTIKRDWSNVCLR
jgi:hypothetical protein